MKDKVSITNAAQRFAARGQIDEAIAEWSKLIAVSKDGNVYNTIGDLYLKKRAQNEAVNFFTKAANIFREEGFFPKAIALYKKILNIVPNRLDAVVALAELNAERGFSSQASTELLRVAERLEREGDANKALEVYEKALRLLPFETDIKIKIAELSQRLGLNERAAKGYTIIGTGYLEKGEYSRAREFFNRAIGISPDNPALLRGLGTLEEKENNTEQALEFLSKALAAAPEDRNIMLRFASIAVKANRAEEARQQLVNLVENDPTDTDAKKLLGQIYLGEGLLDNAWEEMMPCIDEALNSEDFGRAAEMLNSFRDINSIPVRQRFADIYRAKGDNENLFNELSRIADINKGQQSFNEALLLYRECLQLRPDSSEIKEKIKEIEAEAGLQPEQGMESYLAETSNAAAPVSGQEQVSPEAVLNEVEKMSEVQGEKTGPVAEDYESHFQLGVNYRRQGFLNDAIREFRIASEDPEKAVRNARMLALCYAEKGFFQDAIKEFRKVIDKMSPEDAGYTDMLYEMAEAYSNNNDSKNAMKIYRDIYNIDPSFRDVAQKVESMDEGPSGSPDKPKHKTKKNRISYL